MCSVPCSATFGKLGGFLMCKVVEYHDVPMIAEHLAVQALVLKLCTVCAKV